MSVTFTELFDGRRDVVGGENGLCIHKPADADDDWWRHMMEAHLRNGGAQAVGTYPLRSDGTARWGCVDVDVEDRVLTQAVYAELWDLGVKPYVEISRSKGYHVWWFYPEFIPGWIARVLGLTVCDRLNVELECNPKQFELEAGKVGNYVRSPYPGYITDRHTHDRRVFMENGQLLSLDEFLQTVEFSHAAASRTAAIQSPLCPVEYVLGVKLPVFAGGPSRGFTGPSNASNQAAFDIAFRGAPVRKGERDNQLYTVANLMWACCLNEEEAIGRMTTIHAQQVEEAHTYALGAAIDKVRNVYRTRGRPQRRPMQVRGPIPVIV